MKKILSILLVLFSAAGFSQTLEALKADTRKISDANYTMDFDAVAALTYPKVYEDSGKAAFIEKLDHDYQNEAFRMRLEIEKPVFQYSEVKKIAGKSFCIISYNNPVRYFFENKLTEAAAKQKAALLKQNTLAPEVVFEPKRNSFNVRRNSKLIAVSDELTQHEWRFFNFDDPMQRQLFDALFGDVKKELGL